MKCLRGKFPNEQTISYWLNDNQISLEKTERETRSWQIFQFGTNEKFLKNNLFLSFFQVVIVSMKHFIVFEPNTSFFFMSKPRSIFCQISICDWLIFQYYCLFSFRQLFLSKKTTHIHYSAKCLFQWWNQTQKRKKYRLI